MNAQQKKIAETCLHAAETGSMAITFVNPSGLPKIDVYQQVAIASGSLSIARQVV